MVLPFQTADMELYPMYLVVSNVSRCIQPFLQGFFVSLMHWRVTHVPACPCGPFLFSWCTVFHGRIYQILFFHSQVHGHLGFNCNEKNLLLIFTYKGCVRVRVCVCKHRFSFFLGVEWLVARCIFHFIRD